jgi:dihydroxyacetone kinase-like protein
MLLGEEEAKAIVALMGRRMEENRDRLIELDQALGDGDLGLTMSIGFAKAAEAVAAENGLTPGKVFVKAGATLAAAAPSTMGTLLATGFMKGGKAVADRAELDTSGVAVMLAAFTGGIAARGKAQPGEKTILDALVPACAALEAAAAAGEALAACLGRAAEAAEQGMLATRGMIAVHGRPSYYGESSRGKQDPGATVGCLIVQAFAGWAQGKG